MIDRPAGDATDRASPPSCCCCCCWLTGSIDGKSSVHPHARSYAAGLDRPHCPSLPYRLRLACHARLRPRRPSPPSRLPHAAQGRAWASGGEASAGCGDKNANCQPEGVRVFSSRAAVWCKTRCGCGAAADSRVVVQMPIANPARSGQATRAPGCRQETGTGLNKALNARAPWGAARRVPGATRSVRSPTPRLAPVVRDVPS